MTGFERLYDGLFWSITVCLMFSVNVPLIALIIVSFGYLRQHENASGVRFKKVLVKQLVASGYQKSGQGRQRG